MTQKPIYTLPIYGAIYMVSQVCSHFSTQKKVCPGKNLFKFLYLSKALGHWMAKPEQQLNSSYQPVVFQPC